MQLKMRQRVVTAEEVLNQTDYRSVLRAHYSGQKKRRTGFSYTTWSRELGLRSASSLIMILNGQRHPGPALTLKLSANLGLTGMEGGYFRDLVAIQKAQDKSLGSAISLLSRIRKKHGPDSFRFVDFETFEAIAEWHYAAIREMVGMSGFRENPEWISRKLAYKVTPKQVRQAIDTLLRLGLLKRGKGSRLVSGVAHMNVGQDVQNLAVRRFHEQGLANAASALNVFPTNEREFYSTTFAFPSQAMAEAKLMIRKFHDEFCDRFESAGSDRIMQFQICFYPLTHLGDGT